MKLFSQQITQQLLLYPSAPPDVSSIYLRHDLKITVCLSLQYDTVVNQSFNRPSQRQPYTSVPQDVSCISVYLYDIHGLKVTVTLYYSTILQLASHLIQLLNDRINGCKTNVIILINLKVVTALSLLFMKTFLVSRVHSYEEMYFKVFPIVSSNSIKKQSVTVGIKSNLCK